MSKKSEALLKMTLEAINRIVAPESLLLAHKLQLNEEEKEFGMKITEILEPGDIILTQTPVSFIYEMLRSMANSYFDHVSVLLDKQNCLQVGPPRAQTRPAYYFLVMNRKPLVLRLPEAQRKQFLENVNKLIEKKYNYVKALNTWLSLVFYEKTNMPMKIKDLDPDKLICTDAILGSVPRIEELRKKYRNFLDFENVGSHSLNDFLVLAEKAEFEVVKLPFPFGKLTSEGNNYKQIARKMLQQESLFSSVVNFNNLLFTGRLLSSTKKKRYRNAYRLSLLLVQAMKFLKIGGVEVLYLFTLLWPKI